VRTASYHTKYIPTPMRVARMVSVTVEPKTIQGICGTVINRLGGCWDKQSLINNVITEGLWCYAQTTNPPDTW